MAGAGNLLGLELYIRAALQTLTAAYPQLTVGSAVAFAGATEPHRHVPGVFVRPGSHANVEDDGPEITQDETWEVAVAVPAIVDRNSRANTYQALGELGWAAVQALKSIDGLKYSGFGDISEQLGWAELPLTFTVRTAISQSAPADLADFARFHASWDLAPPDGDPEAVDDVQLPTQPAEEPAP